jgi:AcrR family transcriptional regulator
MSIPKRTEPKSWPSKTDDAPLELPTLSAPARQGKLPRGANSLSRAEVEDEQRKRLIAATAMVVAERGYAEATVADLTAAAGISRATFYVLFSDKEECFLYGYKKLSEAHLKAVNRELSSATSLPEALRAGIAAYLRRIDVDHRYSRAFLCEAEAATARSRELFYETQGRLLESLREWLEKVRKAHPGVEARNTDDLSLVVSGINGFIINHVRSGRIFADQHIATVLRFVFAGLGLFGWADHVGQGDLSEASNGPHAPRRAVEGRR